MNRQRFALRSATPFSIFHLQRQPSSYANLAQGPFGPYRQRQHTCLIVGPIGTAKSHVHFNTPSMGEAAAFAWSTNRSVLEAADKANPRRPWCMAIMPSHRFQVQSQVHGRCDLLWNLTSSPSTICGFNPGDIVMNVFIALRQ